MDNWLKIKSFNQPCEAELAKDLLESAEIPVIINGEIYDQLNIYVTSGNGIELLVPADQFEKAKTLLGMGE